MKTILFVANVAKEHLNKFHIPTIRAFKDKGWMVDCASNGDEPVPCCDHDFTMPWKRTPFTTGTFKGVSELKKHLKNHRYDIIYCHTPVGGLVARIAAKNARKKGTKVIYFAHGFHFYHGAPILNWLLYYPVEKWLAGKTDVIFTINNEDYSFAKKHLARHGCQICLVPGMGIDTARLETADREKDRRTIRARYHIPDSSFVLIYIAELIPNKNQSMLLKTLKILLKQHQNVHLLLVGPDHADGRYQKMAEELGIAENVTFAGWQSDIGPYLYASDLCAASSIREGFPINLPEAMYCGLPVVATDNRGHRMTIEDGKNGYLVPLDDAETMADRIKRIIENPELRRKFSVHDKEKYDNRTIAKQLQMKIEMILDGAKSVS